MNKVLSLIISLLFIGLGHASIPCYEGGYSKGKIIGKIEKTNDYFYPYILTIDNTSEEIMLSTSQSKRNGDTKQITINWDFQIPRLATENTIVITEKNDNILSASILEKKKTKFSCGK